MARGVLPPRQPALPADVLRAPRDRHRAAGARRPAPRRRRGHSPAGAPAVALLEREDPRPHGRGDHVPAGADHRRPARGSSSAGRQPAVPFWCLGALQELSTKNNMDQSATTNLLNTMQPTTDHTAAMFFVVVSCVWFGTSNAAREIVTERAIYLRERMVNLRLVNYVLSKYILLSFFCVVQCTMLLGDRLLRAGLQRRAGGVPRRAREPGRARDERDGARSPASRRSSRRPRPRWRSRRSRSSRRSSSAA